MIITGILSGLGNQMFQYAAGRSLAEHHRTILKLDISWFSSSDQQTPRNYELDVFRVPEPIATSAERAAFTHRPSGGIFNRLRNKINRNRPPHKQYVYCEPHFHIDPHFYKARSSTLLRGYWQSEFYFLPIAGLIRRQFSIASLPGAQNKDWEHKIRNVNAVSLHVRRGDMVNHPEVARVHGSCDLSYYRTAVGRIAELVENPVFFIFSDDPAWCLQHLELSFPFYIIDNNQGEHSYIDMQLMRMCRHHIIANSSFSWWGAWLNDFPGKKVISPLRWFNEAPHNTKDLIPQGWIRL